MSCRTRLALDLVRDGRARGRESPRLPGRGHSRQDHGRRRAVIESPSAKVGGDAPITEPFLHRLIGSALSATGGYLLRAVRHHLAAALLEVVRRRTDGAGGF